MKKEDILKATKEALIIEFKKLHGGDNCYNCYNCNNCYSCNNCDNCYNCGNCYNCYNCYNCNNCCYCYKQQSQRYMVLNVQLTEEEYLDYKKKKD